MSSSLTLAKLHNKPQVFTDIITFEDYDNDNDGKYSVFRDNLCYEVEIEIYHEPAMAFGYGQEPSNDVYSIMSAKVISVSNMKGEPQTILKTKKSAIEEWVVNNYQLK